MSCASCIASSSSLTRHELPATPLHRFEDDVHDHLRRRDARRMIDRMRPHAAPSSAPAMKRCVSGGDHAILFGHEEPARPAPSRAAARPGADAGHGDRPLNGRQDRLLFGGGFWAKAAANASSGKPDQPVIIRRQLRRLRMRLGAIEHVGDGFAFIRRKRRNIDQRFAPSRCAVAAMTAPA